MDSYLVPMKQVPPPSNKPFASVVIFHLYIASAPPSIALRNWNSEALLASCLFSKYRTFLKKYIQFSILGDQTIVCMSVAIPYTMEDKILFFFLGLL